jgi:hypothetical protein
MPDIVLDTCALDVLLDDVITDRIVARRDQVFVEQCTWRKELKGVYTHLINLFHESVKKLKNNFHEATTVRNTLPDRLKNEIVRNGGDNCDVRIANLACERCSRTGQDVYLISNDSCFHNPKPIFNRRGVEVRSAHEFRADY